MPEKDGDEGKSTKSVVNKKQKQMMGEEGYDIARDMGRVRPSKDKKDATTMPPSKEMKKTQKVNKGPSAFERVKAKYGKSVMKVEELDLTQVAEAFGGYIVEAPVDDREEKKNKAVEKLARAAGINIRTQGPEQAAATDAFADMRMSKEKKFSDITSDVKKGMRATAVGKGRAEPKDQMSPSSGGKRKATNIDSMKSPVLRPTTGGRKIKKKLSPSQKEAELEGKRKDYLDPKTNKASPEGVKRYITKARQMRSGSNVPVDQETTDNIAKIAGKEYEDKINQKYGGRRATRRQSTFTPPAFATRTGESGGPLPVSMRNKRVPKTSSIVPVDTSAIVPTKQTTIPKPEVKPEVKPDEEKVKPQEVDAGSGGIRPPRNIKKRFGPTPPKGPSEFSKSLTKVKDFANKNPVAALATYDLGKGVLGKILNTRQLVPGVVGGTVGRRSARGGGGL